jgi:hypothetical protein
MLATCPLTGGEAPTTTTTTTPARIMAADVVTTRAKVAEEIIAQREIEKVRLTRGQGRTGGPR